MPQNHKYMYLLVTQDVYELPLDFADTVRELAKRHGVSAQTVISGAWYAEKEGRMSKWRRVKL